jgi:hypothetical protein
LKCQEDREDYCQDMYLILLETPLEKLQKLDEEGKLADYFARICINQLVNQKSVTHKKLETYIQKISLDNYETDRQRETQECS